jgi:hypothetical protein
VADLKHPMQWHLVEIMTDSPVLRQHSELEDCVEEQGYRSGMYQQVFIIRVDPFARGSLCSSYHDDE